MGVQFGTICGLMLCAMVVVPYCHDHRMGGAPFIATLLVFTGIPFVVGIRSKQAHRSVMIAALLLLLLCPLVYAITDPLAVEFEQARDSFFLGTFSASLLASSAMLVSPYRAGSWLQHATAVFGGISSALGIFVLLWMIMYFE